MLIANSMQSQNILSGTVTDLKSGKSLPGATVIVEGTYYATVSNEEGKFEFKKLTAGKYNLQVRYVGYTTINRWIEIPKDNLVKFELAPVTIVQDEVIISATRAGKESGMATTEISSEQIQNANTGKDVPFLLEGVPSLVATSDAGTGVGYTGIRIRGSDASRINVTINGIPINDSESQNMYWVDLPDLASSIDNVQVQRGVGTSTNGAGAFGGSINIQTSTPSDSSYVISSNSFGSFNTLKNTISLGTGMLNNHWNFQGRLSKISSDGFIDRATSNLKSFFVSGGYYGKKDLLKVNIFSGKEITYQSWYGVPEASLDTNRTWNYYTYDNQVDDYQQDHYQLFYTHEFMQGLHLNTALHYTYGRGYYEELKEGEAFADYNLENVIIGGDTITTTNLVRRLWLDNNFYGATWSLNYDAMKNYNFILGGAWNQYNGDHFGEVIWSQYASNGSIRQRYYDNNGLKTDFNLFLKSTIKLTAKLSVFGDVQYRNVGYNFTGVDSDQNPLPQNDNLSFFNPKAGITYTVRPGTYGYLSFSVGNKEPSRDDYTESTVASRPLPERLYDLESGYFYKKNNFYAGFNYFLMMYNNQLVLTGQLNDVGNYTRTNIKNSLREGVEIEGGWNPLAAVSVKGNVTLSRSQISEFKEYLDDYDNGGQQVAIYTNTAIAFSPKITGYLDVSYQPVSQLQFSLINKYTGNQYLDNTSNSNRKLNGWFIQDFRVNWNVKTRFVKELRLSAIANNLFDKKYESNGYTFSYIYDGAVTTENYFYPQAGRNYTVALTINF